MKLWGLSQLNPLLGSYGYDEVLQEEYFDELSFMAPNARRYIEVFNDRELADQIVGTEAQSPLRLWDALGLIIHGRSFVAGFDQVPQHPVILAIHDLLSKGLDRELSEAEQKKLEELNSASQKLPAMRKDMRLTGFTISSDRREAWVSVETLSKAFLEQKFTKLSEWKRTAADFRKPIEE